MAIASDRRRARCEVHRSGCAASHQIACAATIKVYSCNYHRDRGDAVCGNRLRRPVETMDDAVLGWLERNVLHEQIVLEVLDELKSRLASRAARLPEELLQAQTEASALKKELRRLTEALALADEGSSPAVVVQAISAREAKLRALEGRMEVLQAAPKAVELEVHRLKREARSRLQDLRGLLAGNTAEARGVLQALLDGPIVCTPRGRRYQMRAPLAVPEALGFRTDSVPSGV